MLGFVLLPELAHLGIGGWDRTQLSLLPLRFDQALSVELAPLLVGEPAPPFLHRAESRLANLIAKIRFGAELLANVLVGLLDLIEHFLIRHLDGRVSLRLLHEQLELDQPIEHLPAHRPPPH